MFVPEVKNQEQLTEQNSTSTTTTSETSDWQIYQNGKFSFEIKYPSHVSVSEQEGTTFTVTTFRSPEWEMTYFAGMKETGVLPVT